VRYHNNQVYNNKVQHKHSKPNNPFKKILSLNIIKNDNNLPIFHQITFVDI
jgi:hypothetical protein